MKQNIPFDVHVTMFLPTIAGQGTREQQAEWIPRASSNAIIGTYAQVIWKQIKKLYFTKITSMYLIYITLLTTALPFNHRISFAYLPTCICSVFFFKNHYRIKCDKIAFISLISLIIRIKLQGQSKNDWNLSQ